jgi:hypothetical protein
MKEEVEREFHFKHFFQKFPYLKHVIVKRELPEWCSSSTKNQKLLDN